MAPRSRRSAAQPDARRARPPDRCGDGARPAGAPPGSAAHEGPGALARAGARRVPVRQLRLQGAPIFLAMPGVWRVGDIPPAPHGGAGKPRTPPREDATWTVSE